MYFWRTKLSSNGVRRETKLRGASKTEEQTAETFRDALGRVVANGSASAMEKAAGSPKVAESPGCRRLLLG